MYDWKRSFNKERNNERGKYMKTLLNLQSGGGNPLKLFLQGFTLAEVLITLGIIGVVAAITIPGLINSYKAHQLRSQFLKSYSIITQVAQHMKK